MNHPDFPGWEVLEKMGEGGMCAVYRARPIAGGQECALKLLLDSGRSATERFTTEAHLLRSLQHPNVVRVYQLHAGPPPWLVMELLEGRDLDETRAEGPLDPERAASLFADLANGLALVHQRGVRHRDIKPANIMLGRDGVARLIDFGIARQLHANHVTQQGYVIGTHAYFPPEVFGEDPNQVQDLPTTDVYARAHSLCEVLTSVPVHPREGSDAGVMRVMVAKMEQDHLDPRRWHPNVPAGLAEVVMRATRRDRERRTPTAAQLEAELRAWLQERRQAAAAPISRIDPSRLPPPPSRRRETTPSAAAPRREATPAPAAPAPTPPPPPADQGAPPAPRSRWWMGALAALSAAGLGAAATAALAFLALLVVGALLVGALWFRAPALTGSLEAEVAAQAQQLDLGRCAPSNLRRVDLRMVLENGRARSVQVTGADNRTAACIQQRVSTARWPHTDRPIEVALPLALR